MAEQLQPAKAGTMSYCVLQAQAAAADVVVMSYETLRSDVDWVASCPWLYCVLDEGHMIRNPKSKVAQVWSDKASRHGASAELACCLEAGGTLLLHGCTTYSQL